ncbi:MAG: ribosome maturation factor RimP [Syntrophomonadaceae bacterium]|nr:ribosome maturation factor RimP [Syntrophomonadaceae bacterium]
MVRLSAQEIEKLIEPILEGINVELVDIQYRMENKSLMLRLFIDSEEGVSLGLCTDVTRLVKKEIDDRDIDYDHMEVSSPGLDRIIKRNKKPERFIGEQVQVKMQKTYSGPKKVVGVLKGVNNETITVENNTDSYSIPWDVITTLRLHPDFV